MDTIHYEEGGDDHAINVGGDSSMRKKEVEQDGEREKEREELLLLPYLNEDIVTNIIVKTPAEARLNRLRYVCKPWYNFVNNDPGMALYRLLSSKSSPCLILQKHDRTSPRYINSGITKEEITEICNDPTYTTCFIKMGTEGIDVQEEYDLTTPFRKLCIMACANGLMLAIPKRKCIFSYSTALLYLVNPLTNQRLQLPLPQGIKHFPQLSFIFLPSTREYKVLGITNESIHILTLSGGIGNGSGSNGTGTTSCPCKNINNVDDLKWRLVETPPDKPRYLPLAINETFYWVRGTPKEDYIVSFDARAEKFYNNSSQVSYT